MNPHHLPTHAVSFKGGCLADILHDRDHVNNDLQPYVCISEKCPQPPRFGSSSQWFQHMCEAHGRNWHRELHAPLSWICPLCIGSFEDEKTTFSGPAELTNHLNSTHGETGFTDSQVGAIVRQSRVQTPRPPDICPLCHHSMKPPERPPILEQEQRRRLSSAKQPLQGDVAAESSSKRIKTETGHRQASKHGDGVSRPIKVAENQTQHPETDSYNDPPLNLEEIAAHIAGHLQGITMLTQRMIAIDGAVEISADGQSETGRTDDDLTFLSLSLNRDESDHDSSSESAQGSGCDGHERLESAGEGNQTVTEDKGEEAKVEPGVAVYEDWSGIPNKHLNVDTESDVVLGTLQQAREDLRRSQEESARNSSLENAKVRDFMTMLRSKGETFDMEDAEDHAWSHLRARFPNAPPFLVARLVSAVVFRRMKVRYRQRHQSKLRQGIDNVDSFDPEPQVPGAGYSKPASDLPGGQQETFGAATRGVIKAQQLHQSLTIPSVVTAPTVATKLFHENYARSIALSERTHLSVLRRPKLDVPSPPENMDEALECPYCMRIISSEETEEPRWR